MTLHSIIVNSNILIYWYIG